MVKAVRADRSRKRVRCWPAVLLLIAVISGAITTNSRHAGAASASLSGYYTVDTDGAVSSFGAYIAFGSAGDSLNRPIVGMAATPDGNGYWLVASDGGIFTFGDAGFYGSAGAIHLNRPIVGMAATADGKGYWLVASDGGIFTFGDATYFGSGVQSGANVSMVGIAVQASSQAIASTTVPASPVTTTTVPASPVTTTTSMLQSLKLMNYYPSDGAWPYMWQNWNLSAINQDFAGIAALHANAVRIIIQASTFGYPSPSPTMQSRLAAIIASAQSNGLKVQLTLFDWWDGYTDLVGSTQWATAVLAPYKNNPEIAFVELQNEMDPGNPAAMAWARNELPVVEGLAGSIPVTISITGPDTPTVLTALKTALGPDQPDFYDVHYYGSAGGAYGELAQDKAIAAPSALFVGETGMSTAPTSGESEAQAESNQDLYLRSVEWATEALGLPAAAPWIYQDLAPGAIPPQSELTSDQSDYGLLRVDGSEKPAAASISQFFETGSVSTQLNNNFADQSDGQPLGWAAFDATQGTLTWGGAVSHSGDGSVSLSDTGGSTSAVPSYETSPIIIPTHNGQTFQATVWAMGSAATGSNCIAISWFDSSGNYLGETQSADLPAGNSTWSELTVDSTAPVNASYEEISLKSSYNTGTVWFDDVTFVPLD